MTIKERRVGYYDIYVNDEQELWVDDLMHECSFNLTQEFKGDPIDNEMMDKVERLASSGEFDRRREQRRNGILDFMN